jgi:hypothetical protein
VSCRAPTEEKRGEMKRRVTSWGQKQTTKTRRLCAGLRQHDMLDDMSTTYSKADAERTKNRIKGTAIIRHGNVHALHEHHR